jgi:predicted transcriptional regulator
MKTAKQATLDLVQDLPDEVSMDTILAKLAYLARIDQGLADAERGDIVPHAQVMEELRQWQKSPGR